VPVIGAVGVAGYAYFDTAQVAKTAIELFEGGVEIDPPDGIGASTAAGVLAGWRAGELDDGLARQGLLRLGLSPAEADQAMGTRDEAEAT
jgi:hypothetical protein